MKDGYKVWDTDTHCRPSAETRTRPSTHASTASPMSSRGHSLSFASSSSFDPRFSPGRFSQTGAHHQTMTADRSRAAA